MLGKRYLCPKEHKRKLITQDVKKRQRKLDGDEKKLLKI